MKDVSKKVLDSAFDKAAHDKWLKKYEKTKSGKIMNILYDIRECEVNLKNYDKETHLCSVLSIATKGTKMEEDVVEIIKLVCPRFYEE